MKNPASHIYDMLFLYLASENTRSWEFEHTLLPTKVSPTNQASCQDLQRFSRTSQNIISKEDSIKIF